MVYDPSNGRWFAVAGRDVVLTRQPKNTNDHDQIQARIATADGLLPGSLGAVGAIAPNSWHALHRLRVFARCKPAYVPGFSEKSQLRHPNWPRVVLP